MLRSLGALTGAPHVPIKGSVSKSIRGSGGPSPTLCRNDDAGACSNMGGSHAKRLDTEHIADTGQGQARDVDSLMGGAWVVIGRRHFCGCLPGCDEDTRAGSGPRFQGRNQLNSANLI